MILNMEDSIWEVRNLIKLKITEINNIHGFNYGIEEEKLPEGYMMVADADGSHIVFDPKNISELFVHPEFEKRVQIFELEDFITILLLHEIGHLLDYKKNSSLFYSDEHLEQLEINAWDISEKLIEKRLLKDFHSFKHISMEHYKRDGMF